MNSPAGRTGANWRFRGAELHHAIEPQRVLCQDEMLQSVDTEDLQSQLWGMFPYMVRGVMSLPQLDRVRWILFPDIRVAQTRDADGGPCHQQPAAPVRRCTKHL